MRSAVSLLGMVLLVHLVTSSAFAVCDPSTDPDKSDIANARAAIAAQCSCTTAATHGAYVSCAVQEANAVLGNKSCAGAVKKCASRSTCGRPGAVTCCRTSVHGTTRGSVKRAASSCRAPAGGTACVGSLPSVCDACGGSECVVTTTSTTVTSTTTTTTTTLPCSGDGGPCDAVSCCAGLVCQFPADTCATCIGDGSIGCVQDADCCAPSKCFGELCFVGGTGHGIRVCSTCLEDVDAVPGCILTGCTSSADCCNANSGCAIAHAAGSCTGPLLTGICNPQACMPPGFPCGGCPGDSPCCSGVCSGTTCQ